MKDEEKYRELLDHNSSQANDELGEFILRAKDAGIPEGKGKEKLWAAIDGQLHEKNSANRSLWTYLSVAAAIALIVSLALLFQKGNSDFSISTGIAESQTQLLPDGSQATLNANSLLSYSGKWDRKLELIGEAYFEVKEGERFIVSTPSGDVEVLGTSFNVFARDGNLEVECRTGKVKVTVPEKSFEDAITPGEMISFKKDTVRKMLRKPELIGRWKAGEFYFNNQSIVEVMDELKRQFKIKIDYDGNEDIAFNGYFTNKNLDTALEMVCLPLGLEYQKLSTSRIVIRESEE